jgi:2-polyprenyl-3-methyl-5-hydroxy-6-metoxy-1,4-benzoquinol methylase
LQRCGWAGFGGYADRLTMNASPMNASPMNDTVDTPSGALTTTAHERPNRYGHSRRPDMLDLPPATASKVLDIGCHSGAFGEALKAQRPCEVWGVEPDAAAAGMAQGLLDRVIVAPCSEALDIPEKAFDAVVFNDVLEHLPDPWAVLRSVQRHLRPGGCVLACVPNMLHKDNLEHLLRERDFRYEDQGIRDRTHLRFFTRKSAVRLFEESGYKTDEVRMVNDYMWYPTSLLGRVAYKLFARDLEETRFIQIGLRATPRPAAG